MKLTEFDGYGWLLNKKRKRTVPVRVVGVLVMPPTTRGILQLWSVLEPTGRARLVPSSAAEIHCNEAEDEDDPSFANPLCNQAWREFQDAQNDEADRRGYERDDEDEDDDGDGPVGLPKQPFDPDSIPDTVPDDWVPTGGAS